jgi:hypothetical protein
MGLIVNLPIRCYRVCPISTHNVQCLGSTPSSYSRLGSKYRFQLLPALVWAIAGVSMSIRSYRHPESRRFRGRQTVLQCDDTALHAESGTQLKDSALQRLRQLSSCKLTIDRCRRKPPPIQLSL